MSDATATLRMPENMTRLAATRLQLHAADGGPEEGAQVPEWIHLSPAGVAVDGVEGMLVQGRDGREFVILDPQAVIDSTELPLSLDIDHRSMMVGWVDSASTEAFGWVEELAFVSEEDVAASPHDSAGFWGRVEWTEPGAELVRSKRFRNLSPVIEMEWRAPENEREVAPPAAARAFVNVALTNLPNLRLASLNARGGHQPSANAETEQTTMTAEEILEAARTMLGLAEDATAEDTVRALAEALGVELPAPSEEGGEGGDAEENEANARGDLAVAMERNAALTAELASFRQAEAEHATDLAIAEGRAPAAHRSHLVGLFSRDRETFDGLTAAPAATPNLSSVTNDGTGRVTLSENATRTEIDAAASKLGPKALHLYRNFVSAGYAPAKAYAKASSKA